MRSKWFSLVALVGALVLGAGNLPAQYARPALTRGVTIKQKLGDPVPLDLIFRDEAGQTVPLRSYFGDKPVIISMVYFKCPSLCPMSVRETVLSLKKLNLQAGIDYNVLVVSFDPRDKPQDASDKKYEYRAMFNRVGFDQGFHFLTGTEENTKKLADAVGFGFRWDEATKQYIHAGGIMVATPDGRMSRYFYGVDYSPSDVRLALAEASKHKISSPVNYVLLFCFHYDSAQGKYTLAIMNLLKLGGALTVLLVGGTIFLLKRKEKNNARMVSWKGSQKVQQHVH